MSVVVVAQLSSACCQCEDSTGAVPFVVAVVMLLVAVVAAVVVTAVVVAVVMAVAVAVAVLGEFWLPCNPLFSMTLMTMVMMVMAM